MALGVIKTNYGNIKNSAAAEVFDTMVTVAKTAKAVAQSKTEGYEIVKGGTYTDAQIKNAVTGAPGELAPGLMRAEVVDTDGNVRKIMIYQPTDLETLTETLKREKQLLLKDTEGSKVAKEEAPASDKSYAQILLDRYDDINTSGKYITVDEVKTYYEQNPDLNGEEKAALEFWMQGDAFAYLDVAKKSANAPSSEEAYLAAQMFGGHDGNVDRGDIEAWISNGLSLEAAPGYASFMEKNKDAGDLSKSIVQYADFILKNYDEIKDANDDGKFLTREDVVQYREQNSSLSKEEIAALDFWANPGAFQRLDTSHKSLSEGADGKVGFDDLKTWISKDAPTNSSAALEFVSNVAKSNAVDGVDLSKINKDVFEHPEAYTPQERAAVLQELLSARDLIIAGSQAGMWGDDKSIVTVSNYARTHPNPERLLQDVNEHIEILASDAEVVKLLNESTSSEINRILENDPNLKADIRKAYEEDILSGKAFDELWKTKSEGGNANQQEILAEFLSLGMEYQKALGVKEPQELQEGVKNSSHNQELQEFYEKGLVSGDRLRELLGEHSFSEAAAIYSMEVALYNSALDADFTGKLDIQLNENFSKIAEENLFKDASFEDLKKVYGRDGGEELDEAKIKNLLDQMRKDSPELFLNEDGSVATDDQALAAVRANWDMLRQGTKTLDKMGTIDSFDPSGNAKKDYGRGLFHTVSGLFLGGVTIARGTGNAGALNQKQMVDIATGSVQTMTLITEGGVKGAQQFIKDAAAKSKELDFPGLSKEDLNRIVTDNDFYAERVGKNLKLVEESAKGLGALAGVVGGAYGIFDSLNKIRSGDTVGGSFGFASAFSGLASGLASGLEAGLGLFASSVPKFVPIMAGFLGWVAGGVAVLAGLVPFIATETKQELKTEAFGELLGNKLNKYEVDGVKDGTFSDIPMSDWPKDHDSGLS